jgi:hypothetical protein
MVDVSPIQTPLCVFLSPDAAWPDNLRIAKGACDTPAVDVTPYDVIRGKLCNLAFSNLAHQVDLGHVQCLYDDAHRTEFDDLSPDDSRCFGGWFYLVKQSGDPSYGTSSPGGLPRLPSSGACP